VRQNYSVAALRYERKRQRTTFAVRFISRIKIFTSSWTPDDQACQH